MQVITVVLGAGAILAFCGLVWYKFRGQVDNTAVLEKQAADQATAKVSLEKQIAEKNEQERQELDGKIEAANQEDVLKLLAALRGVH